MNENYHYFSEDGSYGAGAPLTIDTTNWTEEDWRDVEDTSDNERMWLALNISKKYKDK